jgi:predicted nucleic acid-binding protein
VAVAAILADHEAHEQAAIVNARLPSSWVALDAEGHAAALPTLSAAGVGAGATYDGLIALTALAHDVLLISLDRRAARTYRALGARFELLDR